MLATMSPLVHAGAAVTRWFSPCDCCSAAVLGQARAGCGHLWVAGAGLGLVPA